MIIFDLKCNPQGHVFEAWFASSAAFAEQSARGLVACPLCGSDRVAKAPMAPAVAIRPEPGCAPLSPTSSSADKAILAAAAALQKRLLQGSEGVGNRFADEARAIHLGEAEARPIHGEATHAEAESLIDEGIPITPLPFPVVPPGEEN
jgi:hypothetical protein